MTGKKGERAELVELRGFASADIGTAFLDVEIQAQGTRAEKPFFHAYVRLAAGEALDRKQWRYVADRIEKQLGFAGQPRAVAFHHLPAGDDPHAHRVEPDRPRGNARARSRPLQIQAEGNFAARSRTSSA